MVINFHKMMQKENDMIDLRNIPSGKEDLDSYWE